MANIINITESGNRLEFTTTYSPIVCGNSNYYLHFVFGDVWSKCVKKTAVFVVDGKKIMVDFEGEDVKVPVMPNAPCVFVSLVSGLGYEQLATTPLKITLEPSPSASKLAEVEQLAGYLPKIYGMANSFLNGDMIVKTAEFANNVANPNLLINGDFRVNQRGNTEYALASGYTVDRWKVYQSEAKCVVKPETNGVSVSNANGNYFATFRQEFEWFESLRGKTVTYSVEVQNVAGNIKLYFEDGKVSTIYSDNLVNGVNFITFKVHQEATKCTFGLNFPAGSSVVVKYAKAEIGNQPTAFVPRLYAEELAMCKRYYQTIFSRQISGSTAASVSETSNLVYAKIQYEVEMRVVGTRVQKQLFTISCQPVSGSPASFTQNTLGLYFSYCTTKGGFYGFKDWTGLPKGSNYFSQQEGVCLEIDAEIY